MEAREDREKDKIPETNKMLIIRIFYYNTMVAVVADLCLLQVYMYMCLLRQQHSLLK